MLHSTNNFPEFTGRVCPAPCEAACTLNINNDAVAIKSIEHAIIDKGWEEGWVAPQPPAAQDRPAGRGRRLRARGPRLRAAARARRPRRSSVFEKNDRIGGLLRYGIPDFKMEKYAHRPAHGADVGRGRRVPHRASTSASTSTPAKQLIAEFDAVVLAGGAEQPRDLPVPGRELDGVHFAMEFLPQQNRVVAGDDVPGQLLATGKHVVVIGGGDTGSRLRRHVEPPRREVGHPVRAAAAAAGAARTSRCWPYWPIEAAHLVVARGRLRARLGGRHQALRGPRRQGRKLVAARVEWKKDATAR